MFSFSLAILFYFSFSKSSCSSKTIDSKCTFCFLSGFLHSIFMLWDSFFSFLINFLIQIFNFLCFLFKPLCGFLTQFVYVWVELILCAFQFEFKLMLKSQQSVIGSLGLVSDKLLTVFNFPEYVFGLPFDILESGIELFFPFFPIFLHELEIVAHVGELFFEEFWPLTVLFDCGFGCHFELLLGIWNLINDIAKNQ